MVSLLNLFICQSMFMTVIYPISLPVTYQKNKYSEHAKTATVRPIFKKDDRTKIKNYRPVSLLNMFSKIYERFFHENLTNYVNTFLSIFILVYRKSYSTNVLIRLIDYWKKSLNEKKLLVLS